MLKDADNIQSSFQSTQLSDFFRMSNHKVFEWLNPPPHWSEDREALTVTTGENTDFWNRTFYGFTHASGHLRYCQADGDFSAEVKVSAYYEHLYDQAGLMVMVDSDNWLKCGLEFTDGGLHFSTVVTRDGFSDWSQFMVADKARQDLGIRITRHGEALRIQYRLQQGSWTLARLAMLAMTSTVNIGMMCCTPTRQGLDVRFERFKLEQAISRELHN